MYNYVPVLSEQITSTQPSVSTAGSRLTIAFFFAIRMTPSAKVTVTTIGRPSGIAATARDTPMVNISSIGRPSIQPIKNITPITQNEINDNC